MIFFSTLKRVPWVEPTFDPILDDIAPIIAGTKAVTHFDIERRQHDTYSIGLALVDDAGEEIDVSRWRNFILSVSLQSRPHSASTVFAIPASFKTDGSDGQVYFEITPSIAAVAGYYHYRIRAATLTNQLITLVEGKYRVLRDRV